MNLVVLQGRLARPAELRQLPSGSQLVNLELTIRPPEGPAETAPIVWFDAPAWASTLEQDASVLVVGRVRRRFFKAGGATQSRVEVVARRVIRASSTKGVRSALTEVSAEVEAAVAQ